MRELDYKEVRLYIYREKKEPLLVYSYDPTFACRPYFKGIPLGAQQIIELMFTGYITDGLGMYNLEHLRGDF